MVCVRRAGCIELDEGWSYCDEATQSPPLDEIVVRLSSWCSDCSGRRLLTRTTPFATTVFTHSTLEQLLLVHV